ncbi:hypothetical protein HZS_7845 [Henneguya salminicola]|nr:hypothetical protein HZS_7845 [Henneguya salminicola]
MKYFQANLYFFIYFLREYYILRQFVFLRDQTYVSGREKMAMYQKNFVGKELLNFCRYIFFIKNIISVPSIVELDYYSLADHFQHLPVSNSVQFVDSTSRTCTNKIEETWNGVKIIKKT